MRSLDGPGRAAGSAPRLSFPPAGSEPSARAPAAALGRLALLYLLVLLPVGWLGIPRTLVSAGALAALQSGVLVLVMARDRARTRFRWRPRRRDAAEAGIIAAALVAALALASLLVGALPDPLREPFLRGYRWELQGAAQVPLALAFVLISAYREELYFRAYLLTVLEEIATPPWLAVLTSALLFGLGHLYQGWLAAVTALLIGVGFALLYRHRPSVHRLAWAHAAFNLTVLTGTLFAG